MQLPWLTPYTAAFYNMGLLQGDSHVALGPFWARAGRCSASDVEQLNFFRAAKEAAQPSGQALGDGGCPAIGIRRVERPSSRGMLRSSPTV